jgi:RNA polymerase sigma-70 factor, ECF subfamily
VEKEERFMQTPVAELLKRTAAGQKLSLDAVMPQVYDELHRLAALYMSRERNSHTLQPTALVSETYLRLVGQHSIDFGNRAQLLGVAAQMMRRILKTHEEKRKAEKRGGDMTIVCLSDSPEPAAPPELLFEDVDELLDRMATLDERQAKVAELRIFGGLTMEETAEFLEVSVATAHRDWVSGRLWLASELKGKR